jgi:aspartyl-tRNA(Asn)/glutamyl-tRNA(Gln) amidotransferase subunit C
MSRIGRAEVERIGHLARLRLAEDEAETLARDLDAILGYAAELAAVDASQVSKPSLGAERATPLRDDRPVLWPGLERALANAPDCEGTAFRVPQVLEGEEEG